MRNIEEVAAEEELRSRRDQRRFLRRALNAAGLALGLLGWTFFSQGDLGSGAFWILLSLAAFLVGWGAHRLNAFPWSAWGMALPVAAAVLGLDLLTGLPSFYWGRDPD
ncbi:MAG TPA: hypothetical protein VFR02_08075, partial [bacterium]|nr:hypothetical protein [bacterium]